jgi:hypothetical protein
MDNDFIGVVGRWIHRQTPGRVSEDALTQFTSGPRVVSVAVIRDWIVVEHGFPSHTWRADLTRLRDQELLHQTQPH